VHGPEEPAPLERDSEDVGRQRVRAVPPDSPLEIAVDRREVAVEHDPEELRLPSRPRQEVGVAARVRHHPIIPEEVEAVHGALQTGRPAYTGGQ
jgi:hypothetical protein